MMTYLATYSINYRGACITAPATPGLVIIADYMDRNGNFKDIKTTTGCINFSIVKI